MTALDASELDSIGPAFLAVVEACWPRTRRRRPGRRPTLLTQARVRSRAAYGTFELRRQTIRGFEATKPSTALYINACS